MPKLSKPAWDNYTPDISIHNDEKFSDDESNGKYSKNDSNCMYIVLVCSGRECPGFEPYCASQVTADFTFTGEFSTHPSHNLGFVLKLILLLILSFLREREMMSMMPKYEKDVIEHAFSTYSDNTVIMSYI